MFFESEVSTYDPAAFAARFVTITQWEPMRIEQIQPRHARLSPLQKSIFDVLATASAAKPMKVSVLWIRLGRQGIPTGSFKSMLADLVRFGVVSHERGAGYWTTPATGE